MINNNARLASVSVMAALATVSILAGSPVARAAASQPADSDPAPADGTAPREDPLAAARMVGTESSAAGLYFLTYGITVSSLSALYSPNGVVEAPGIALGLAVGGLVNVSAGAILVVAGRKRLQATDAWLDARSGRRARFEIKARRRRLYLDPTPANDATLAVTHRGLRLKLAGVGTLVAGGLLNGIGVGVAPLSPGAGIGLNALGWSAVIVGSVVAARGKKMMFRPNEHLGRDHALLVAPTVMRTANGTSAPGLALTARW